MAAARDDRGVRLDMAVAPQPSIRDDTGILVNLQAQYDLEVAACATGRAIARAIVPLAARGCRKIRSRYHRR